jgi:hypothetical protein
MEIIPTGVSEKGDPWGSLFLLKILFYVITTWRETVGISRKFVCFVEQKTWEISLRIVSRNERASEISFHIIREAKNVLNFVSYDLFNDTKQDFVRFLFYEMVPIKKVSRNIGINISYILFKSRLYMSLEE